MSPFGEQLIQSIWRHPGEWLFGVLVVWAVVTLGWVWYQVCDSPRSGGGGGDIPGG